MSAHDFPADLLRAVLHRSPWTSLAAARRLWRAVASDRAVLEAAFRAPWGVRRVLGDPATRAFWRAASLARVVRVTVADVDVEHVGAGVRQRTASSAWPSSPAAASRPLWKGLAPHLKSLMGPWWFCQFDPAAEVAQAARRSFEVLHMIIFPLSG
ncbi:hypothetical protein ZWY2020_058228 [Hordeum vulgare]|nr:hypothetical protein ZWY2020_058228 [Hordeum vulgare]